MSIKLSHEETIDQLISCYTRAVRICEHKCKDYSPPQNFFKNFNPKALESITQRAYEKAGRIANQVQNGKTPDPEEWLDLINYGGFGFIVQSKMAKKIQSK